MMLSSPISEFYSMEELNQILGAVGHDVRIDRSVKLIDGQSISIGSHVRIDSHCVIIGGRGIMIGDYTHFAWGCTMSATGAKIVFEGFNGLSAGVKIFSATDDYSEGNLTNPTVPERFRKVTSGSVVLGKHVIVGANSVVMPGAIFGYGASVGALSYVNKSVPEGAIVSGNPLRLIGKRVVEQLKRLEGELTGA